MKTNSVEIILLGKHLLLDLENLKDEELAMRDRNGKYDFPSGHYFNADNAVKAAEKVDKRLFTDEEMEYIATLPNRWDEKRKGRWITFQTPTGEKEVFFKACGFINYTDDVLYSVGTDGYYWSASPSSSRYASYLGFDSSYVIVHSINNRAHGIGVRCVREL